LLAVRVIPQPRAAEAVKPISSAGERQGLRCRLTAPSGWVLECERWPAAPWLAALMGGGA